ncbi:MFS transporter [Nocardia cyriacigeorgica]|uniref:MFS transporter n=1 Tax=Nocardia cyriacigeorgica TaxID=135487 RepID=UPI0018936006|nr:MFS transporter [Nocardia cyriacigeorgica]MBF6083441.1 MFS transporter [Nocardia cyriacigeorgica]
MSGDTVGEVAASTIDPMVRTARVAVFTVFGLNGFLLAMWVVHIPAITERTGIAHSTLGMFILLMAGAGIVGMRLAGPLADRFGSRALVGVAGVTASVCVIGPGLATGPVTLAIALSAFGFGNGALDVSMNTQAVHVEREYRRPIMSAFHALFSGGGLLGALVGALTLRLGWSPWLTMSLAAGAGVIIVLACLPRLLPHAAPQHESAEPAGRGGSRKVWALAALAFGLLLTEGVANDWSTLQMREHLETDESTAALAFGAFSVTMTLGRFTADRVSGAFGRVSVVRYGSLLAALGLLLILLSPWVPLTLLGWALCGLGLAGGIPQIFTAAGNLGSGNAATDMSRVFSIGYVGLLAGPAVIGWLTALVPLTATFVVPLAIVVLCGVFAGVVAPQPG